VTTQSDLDFKIRRSNERGHASHEDAANFSILGAENNTEAILFDLK
jgi:hypothetical protein